MTLATSYMGLQLAHPFMLGASPLTARTLVRRGFRNWFRPHYPFVYATFRCAGEA